MASVRGVRRRALAFIRLGRPRFLVGGLAMHALGVAAALWAGAALNLPALLLGQLAITATQWMVQYANEYFDVAADRANLTPTFWSGGSRVLPKHLLGPRLALFTAVGLAILAVLAAFGLLLVSGVGAALLVLVTLFISWGYSAPPFQWHSRGIGEAVSALIVTVLTPGLGFYLQAGYLPLWLAVIVWPLFCLQFCFQICINFPDAAGDAITGKRTLVVRSRRAARALYLLVLPAAYAVLPLIARSPLPPFAGPVLLVSAPAALWLWIRAHRGELNNPRAWTLMATVNIAAVIVTAGALAAAFLLARG